jgi:hypothetical protein
MPVAGSRGEALVLGIRLEGGSSGLERERISSVVDNGMAEPARLIGRMSGKQRAERRPGCWVRDF